MFPEVPFFLQRLQNVYELPFFSTMMPWDKSNYTRIIFSIDFKLEKLFQQDVFFCIFWCFCGLYGHLLELMILTHPRESIGPFTSLWSKNTIFNQVKKHLKFIKNSIFLISTDRNSLKSIPIYFCVKISSGSENTSF